ncbi:MAG: TetR/AcrR family transcriptional regulator [Bacteroidetes bacterium]|nr:TetR/AcrR family transcriptional regulator [Bacteroidota bacterium]
MIGQKNLSRKQQIELRATELFKNKGYSATSMRDLAQVLGIEAASLYSHIKSKEEILQKICFRIAQEFFEAKDRIENHDGTPTKRLKLAMVAHIEVITKDADASAVFFHEWRHLSEPYISDFLQMRDVYEGWFISIIEEGIQTGEFVEQNSKFTMLTILSAINWIHNWYKPEGKMSLEEIEEQLVNTLISGIKRN